MGMASTQDVARAAEFTETRWITLRGTPPSYPF
jgi:hypothetical protein